MDPRLVRRLLDRGPADRTVRSQIGIVTDDSPLTVTLGGDSVECLKLDSYTPTATDRVYVLRSGQDPPLVIGAIS
jgi:hypothetical protein